MGGFVTCRHELAALSTIQVLQKDTMCHIDSTKEANSITLRKRSGASVFRQQTCVLVPERSAA